MNAKEKARAKEKKTTRREGGWVRVEERTNADALRAI